MGTPIFPLGWQMFRERPAMYLSPVSLCALRHFVLGFELGRCTGEERPPTPFPLPADFHDWVAYRLHFYGSTLGCYNMIVERLGDGPHAVERFFALLDEHAARTPRIVATLSGGERTYLRISKSEEQIVPYPRQVVLTAYNEEDPGLFVSAADGEEHFPGHGLCPSLECFESYFGPCRSKLTIFDHAAIDRWAKGTPVL